MTAYWSQLDAVRDYTRLGAATDALFVAMGRLVPLVDDHAGARVLATTSRHLGAHAAAWWALVPESALLEPARDAAPAADPVEVDAPAVAAALEDLVGALHALLERTAPLGDGAARRLARLTLADVAAAHALLGAAP